MNRPLRRTSFSSSNSSLSIRKSSISSKDIQAIQAALQKQQKFSSQLLLCLIIVFPIFSFFYLYSIHLHSGSFQKTFISLFSRFPYLLQLIPPYDDWIAWRFTAVLFSLQLIFHWVIPHDPALVLTSSGDIKRPVNSFYSCLLLNLLYIMGAGMGFYRGDTVFIHFNSIILCMAICTLVILTYLIVSYRLGEDHNVTTLADFYFGVEAFPTFLDIDIKHFVRTRITLSLWPLLIISAMYYHVNLYGKLSKSMLGCCVVQLVYIVKSLWCEDLQLNSLDSRRANCGFYRLWSDVVFYPILYSSPIAIVANQQKSLSILSTLAFTAIGVAAVVITQQIDRQKYTFRKAKGCIKISGVDPFFITAKYKADTGETCANLLLGSGYWSICRHPNYVAESVSFLSFSLFQGLSTPPLAFLPPLYIAGFLLVRQIHDEARCMSKYGQYWLQYCNRVPYRMFPGVY